MKAKKMSFSKSGLAIILSKLQVFENPKIKSEQYATDSEIAAEVLWQAYQLNDLKGKVSADLGCGTGLLGIGALLLGAKKVYFVDSDESALEAAKKNLKLVKSDSSADLGQAVFRLADIKGFEQRVEIVLENPPFGTKVRHQDMEFLGKAFGIAPLVYSFHKTGTASFVKGFAERHGFEITHRLDFDFPLKATLKHHKKRIFYAKVSCFRLEKKNQRFLNK